MGGGEGGKRKKSKIISNFKPLLKSCISYNPHSFTVDLKMPFRSGTIIGHIAAKGLNTNLLLQVSCSEDCRFAFAGVQKGSTQMLAWDLSYLPTWCASHDDFPPMCLSLR